MTKVLVLILLLTLTYLKTDVVFAKQFLTEDELKNLGLTGYESINTDSPNYIFKRGLEEFKLRFLFPDKQKKAEYLSKLLDIRFKELVYMINNDQIGIFENTARRYNTFSGKIIGNYKDLNPHLKEQTKNYVKILERLRDRYHSNSSYWLMVQETIDTTQRLE